MKTPGRYREEQVWLRGFVGGAGARRPWPGPEPGTRKESRSPCELRSGLELLQPREATERFEAGE